MSRVAAPIIVLFAALALQPTQAMAQPVQPGLAAPGRIELAQEQPRRRTLLDLLFGRTQREPEPAQPTRQAAPPRTATPSPSVIAVGTKNENATRLAVFGDSMASGLAHGLSRLYANDPNIVVLNEAVGSSGFVRDDFFDWNAAIANAIRDDTFELAVVVVGINDRQWITTASGNAPPLSDAYRAEYSRRLDEFMNRFRLANRPVIWVGLPPMRAEEYSSALAQISSLQRSAAFSNGVEFVDIYDRFVDEAGNYTPVGPDLNGQQVVMRLDDGIHWTDAGADRAAFFVDKAVRLFYRGGAVTIEVADPLTDTDAHALQRPPYQGLGQIRLLEVAGLITSLNEPPRALDGLVVAGPVDGTGIDLGAMANAPAGRVDSFGVGYDPQDPPSLAPTP
jgi:hypothetical protein